jgi:hypothetical protein
MTLVRLALIVVVVALVSAATTITPKASAWTTSSNWYSTTFYFNKSETYRLAWVYRSPSEALVAIPVPWQVKAAVSAGWWAYQQAARRARSADACLKVTWYFPSVFITGMYRGGYCR